MNRAHWREKPHHLRLGEAAQKTNRTNIQDKSMALQQPKLPPLLLKLAQRNQILERAVRSSLPKELASHVTLINLRGGTLILGSDMQAHITTLRFHAPQILQTVNIQLPSGGALRVAWRTVPPPTIAQRNKPLRTPSPATIQSITAAAECVQDSSLRDALQGLARAMRPK